ncbi:MAG TPA: transglycosylase domain-containing protein [Magnetospirillaceae bacterium]|nr:transglycosylase domain-containing protein [Magnetospirillaceae bacterium]
MAKKSSKGKALSLYANLAAKRRSKADAKARRKAEYLATLPKQPLKRLLYRLHPKRVIKFWFSKRGAITLLKLVGVGIIIMAIFIAALFAYYRRELDAFSPEQLAKSVQTTVTKYYDRNGVLLYEDKGEENYKIVVDSNDIAPVMKQATISIEDKDFYKHGGISITAIIRAGFTNLTGGQVSGASTLTQQLIKQVFFAQDAESNRLDVGRKLKEAILSIEVERMYTKDQILSLYLNTVPYGGRRNGVESAARTYFGVSAKELNLSQASLLAAIPQNPSKYNPYTAATIPENSKALIDRQHQVLNDMVEQNYITKEQAEEAKAVPILDTIKPEISDNENMKAPWFVIEVRRQLREQFTSKVVGEGGLTVKTTLDWRLQERAQDSINANFKYAVAINADNMALTAIDVPTGQVLAMVGSHDYNDKKLGNTNAAIAHLDPGSSIKPFIYANLFKPQQGQNYGAGSIIVDKEVKSLFGIDIQNYDGKFKGPLTIRQALGMSRNPPAAQAARIGGLDNAIQTAKDVGDRFYCNGIDYGISAAIGTCAVTQVQHANSYATLARQGEYKPESYILEVKNAQGQVIHQWKDDQAKKVLDPQITYILSDILADDGARSGVFGSNARGFNVPGVKTATKTGTTDDNQGHARDSWMMSYTPRLAVGIWTGRNDSKGLTSLDSVGNKNVITEFQSFAHNEVFAKDGTWKKGDWFAKPAGIQTLSVNGKTDIYPSWYTKPANAEGEKMTFDKVSRKRATDCTPANAKIEISVPVFEDPITKRKTYSPPDGYNPDASDDVHNCSDIAPFATVSVTGAPAKAVLISGSVNQGTFPLTAVSISVDGQEIYNQPVSSSGSFGPINYTFSNAGDHTVTATVYDAGMYQGTASTTKTIASTGGGNPNPILPGRRRGNG